MPGRRLLLPLPVVAVDAMFVSVRKFLVMLIYLIGTLALYQKR